MRQREDSGQHSASVEIDDALAARLAPTMFADRPAVYLEDHDMRESALADPGGVLALYPEGAVIDEAPFGTLALSSY